MYETIVLHRAGVAKALVRCADRRDFDLMQYEALWSLTNISSGNGLTRDLIDAMILPTLRDLLNSPQTQPHVLEQVIWCYGNIAGESVDFRDNVLSQKVVEPMA